MLTGDVIPLLARDPRPGVEELLKNLANGEVLSNTRALSWIEGIVKSVDMEDYAAIPFTGGMLGKAIVAYAFTQSEAIKSGYRCNVFIRGDLWIIRNRSLHRIYLSSPFWATKREAALAAALNRCQVCNASNEQSILDVHHRTYDRLGDEDPEDLIVLCRDCHTLFHDNGRLARPPQSEVNGGTVIADLKT